MLLSDKWSAIKLCDKYEHFWLEIIIFFRFYSWHEELKECMQADNISLGFPTLNEQQDITSKNMGQQLMSPTYININKEWGNSNLCFWPTPWHIHSWKQFSCWFVSQWQSLTSSEVLAKSQGRGRFWKFWQLNICIVQDNHEILR
jgi:hypothetical protein